MCFLRIFFALLALAACVSGQVLQSIIPKSGTVSVEIAPRSVVCVPATGSANSEWWEIGLLQQFLEAPFVVRLVSVHDGEYTRTLQYSDDSESNFHDALSTTSWLSRWTGGVARFSPHEKQCFTFSGKGHAYSGGESDEWIGGGGGVSGHARGKKCVLSVTQHVDWWALAQVGIALVVATMAPKVVRYNIFIYLLGFVLGMTVAMILVLYLILRKVTNVQNLAVVGTIAVVAQTAVLWYFNLLLQQYLWATVAFFSLSGLFGFAMVYRYDLSTRDRTLLSWAMQGISISAAFFAFPHAMARFPNSRDLTPFIAAGSVLVLPVLFRLWVRIRRRSSSKSDSGADSGAAEGLPNAADDRHSHKKNDDEDAEDDDDYDDDGGGAESSSSRTAHLPHLSATRPRRDRSILHQFLREMKGESESEPFIVRGAQPYQSIREFNEIGVRATGEAEKALMEEFERNSSHYAAILSPAARQAMRQLVRARTASGGDGEREGEADE